MLTNVLEKCLPFGICVVVVVVVVDEMIVVGVLTGKTIE